MVGAALAVALADNDFQVTLIEHQAVAPALDTEQFELRVSAITDASLNLFQHLGVWDDIKQQRAFAYTGMHVWDADGFAKIDFDAAQLDVAQLGHIIENGTIQRALWKKAEQHKNIDIRCPASVSSLILDDRKPAVVLADGNQLDADLIVAADGANSRLRELAEIHSNGWPYHQKGVVATMRAELGTQNTAWQRFMPTGPLALLPIAQDIFSIVWSTSDEHATELLAMNSEDFSAAVSDASEHRLGQLTLLGDKAAFPLKLAHADHYIKPGLALVGDAAHVIHPLAGQGVNLGLLDAATLVDVLVDARQRKRPLGSTATLRRYERARKGDNLITQFAMDGFKRLFGNDNKPVKFLRNFGLGLADKFTPLKQAFAQSGMRDYQDLPRLTRPWE